MSLPKVCVVTGTYRRYQYLPELLQSFLNQTYSNKVLVIINDDPDIKLCVDTTKYKNVIVVNNNVRNISYGHAVENARLISTSLVKADYYALFDDDDIHLKNRLTQSVEPRETQRMGF